MKKYKLLETLFFELLQLKPFLPGTLTKQYRVCGKPNCKCIDKKAPKKHPAFQLSYMLENKRSSIYISKSDVDQTEEMTKAYKKLRKIITDISLESVKLTRQYKPAEATQIINSIIDKARSKVLGGKPDSGKLRDAKISCTSWKNKALERQNKLRKDIVTIRDLNDSRDNWHDQTINFKKENEELKIIIRQQQEKITDLENSNWNPANLTDENPRNFTYSLSTIRFAILMVIFGFNSLRGSAMNFKIFATALRKGLPRWTTIQNWILRFGLYKLLKPLPKRKDWIWIIDHTINFGVKKCFVVLAISHEAFEKKNYQLQHKDMEVAVIDIQEKATGKRVAKVLNKLRGEIGPPLQIVSDKGSNIKKGVEIFKKKSKKTIVTYDITHKVSNELKKTLNGNPRWNLFINKIADTKRKSIHTIMAYLAPPKPREKSRWLNLDFNLKWAETILENKHRSRPGRLTNRQQKFRELFGWVDEFKEDIKEWRLLINVVDEAQKEVKRNGLGKETNYNFKKLTEKTGIGNPTIEKIKLKITDFLISETAAMKDDQILLGTSDIIESVFGKFKIFSAKNPMKEIGRSVLTMPILTSEVTIEEVKAAMETISDKELSEWLESNIGVSLFAKRRKAYAKRLKQETV
ncbi:MAG: DUF6788 family protein [candidate division Zixibacteria bacterium]|nr:DUF6788 family protein [candidate division Zixibacteria bacterium]